MTADPSQASSVGELVERQERHIQSLMAEKAALVERVRVRTELLAEMRSWPSIRAAIAGHTLEQRLNAALNDASGAINREVG
jgi:predicted metal-dependent hydrolase